MGGGTSAFTAVGLLEQACKVVIPLGDTMVVLVNPQLKLPGVSTLGKTGTSTKDYIDVEGHTEHFIIKALGRRIKIQQALRSSKRLCLVTFTIDMLFEKKDGDKTEDAKCLIILV